MRRAFSHAQLLRAARGQLKEGELPEIVLGPGEPSHTEILAATLRANRVCEAARTEGLEITWWSVYRDCLAQLLGGGPTA